MLLLPPSVLGRGAPTTRLQGTEAFNAHLNRGMWAAFVRRQCLPFNTPVVFFFCLCAAVQHPLFPSPPSTLVFLATLVLCLFRDLFLSMMFLMVALLLQLIHGSSSLTSHTSPLANLSIIENIHTTVKDTELFSYLYFLKHGRGYCLSLLFVT